MFRFANPTYLWLLLLIPILAVVYHVWAFKRSKRMARFGDKELLKQLVYNGGDSDAHRADGGTPTDGYEDIKR